MTDQPPETSSVEDLNPLAGLGLGPMWRPTPSAWRWARLADAEGHPIFVFRGFNAGGAFGLTLSATQVAQLIAESQEQLDKAAAEPPPQRIRPASQMPSGPPPGPNREQRRNNLTHPHR